MKTAFLSVVGMIGGAIAGLFGGWSAGMTTLVILMGVDVLTGFLAAAVFHNSDKTENGRAESRTMEKGLIRKLCVVLLIIVASRLDLVLGTEIVRDAAVIGFCVNECLSIVENVGLMGVPLPKVLVDAIAVLKDKANEDGEV